MIYVSSLSKGVNANLQNIAESKRINKIINARNNAKNLVKELTPEQKTLQTCLVQVSAKLSEAQHENIKLVEENRELQKRLLLAEDIGDGVDLSGVEKEDIFNRYLVAVTF